MNATVLISNIDRNLKPKMVELTKMILLRKLLKKIGILSIYRASENPTVKV
jgi:hypothetical protein